VKRKSALFGVGLSLASKRKAGGVTPKVHSKKTKNDHVSGAKTGGLGTEDAESLVGHVEESDAAHALRHPQPLRSCARCQWRQWGTSWKAKQGSYMTENRGQSVRVEWVAERSSLRGGAWALGCSVCARAVRKLKGESSLQARQKHGRLESKWARFEIRPTCLQAQTLAQHAMNEGHKMAMEIFMSPETPVQELLSDGYTIADPELLKASVPQPVDWLRAWRHMKEGISFHSSGRLSTTERYAQKAGTESNVNRKVIKALQEIMVEGQRQQKRDWCRSASSIAISLDDRGA